MQVAHHTFRSRDFVGGDLALDFVNTVTARDTNAIDWIDSYDALLRWAASTGAFTKKDLASLAALARADAKRAVAALRRARALRDAFCSVFYSLIAGRAPSAMPLSLIEEASLAAANASNLGFGGGRVAVHWSVAKSGLDLIAHVVTTRALALLESLPDSRLRLCAGVECGWIFIDTSKNGKRRWCDMATCGNAEKARRFAAVHSKSAGKSGSAD